MTATRNTRRTVSGFVSSTKMDKTITVLVERQFKHTKYGKYVRRKKKYHAHDESNQAGVGDFVELTDARPMSKLKRWRLTRIIEAAPDRGVDVNRIAEGAREEAGIGVREDEAAAEAGAGETPPGGES